MDYIRLKKGQTLILKNDLRFSTDVTDKEAKTPVSTWDEDAYENDDPNNRDHTKYGTLKVRPSLMRSFEVFWKGEINFENGSGKGVIKCDADNGKGTQRQRLNFVEPCIYPELHSLPHNSSENEKNTK